MRLLLIRHGETVDNVAQVYAGTLDSALTNHGVTQALRLGSYLASANVKLSKIFSSDLQRAFKTAEYIRLAQTNPLPETTKLKLLREQDFGSYEGKAYTERPRVSDKQGQEALIDSLQSDPDFKYVEPRESMVLRMNTFIDSYLAELTQGMADGDTVAVIAHGIILSFLWRGIMQRFETRNILLAPPVMIADRGMDLKYLGSWANTGYMDLEIRKKSISTQDSGHTSPRLHQSQRDITQYSTLEQRDSEFPPELAYPAILNGAISLPFQASTSPMQQPPSSPEERVLIVKAINCRDHLRGLKKTRGGIGSLQYDEKQSSMDSFVKRRKVG
ncbi:hypothetical protein OIDMADRAFT_118847 [Oidiodendron maius Zn]|uniref:Phosphoglycerate mutase-like protein n=1 Tax=Oidiodendron maius (strain Zn) TaxID=913774 RepID=A0A0C3HHU1_OIDMZ|nr:hypothetical protein OIDMADRAFT_118847 [Oidiodendron maius Zn]